MIFVDFYDCFSICQCVFFCHFSFFHFLFFPIFHFFMCFSLILFSICFIFSCLFCFLSSLICFILSFFHPFFRVVFLFNFLSFVFSFFGCWESAFFWRQWLHDFIEHFFQKKKHVFSRLGGVISTPLGPLFTFSLLSCFSFLIFSFSQFFVFLENCVSAFLFFFWIYAASSLSIQSLTKDVSSVVGVPWSCGVLTTWGGIAGIGLGRLLGREHDSTPHNGVEDPRLLKTELLQIVFFLLFETLHDACVCALRICIFFLKKKKKTPYRPGDVGLYTPLRSSANPSPVVPRTTTPLATTRMQSLFQIFDRDWTPTEPYKIRCAGVFLSGRTHSYLSQPH